MKQAFYLLVALCSLMSVAPASASGAHDRIAQDYLKAATQGNAEGMLGFYHPGEIEDLRSRVVKALEAEAAGGGNTVRKQVFGIVTSLDEVRRMTPANLFLMVARRVGLPAEKVESIKVLGTVEENSQLVHVLARLVPPKDSTARSHLGVVSLTRYGKDWRVVLPAAFQARVDALLTAKDDAAAPPTAANSNRRAGGVPNTPEIINLLDSGSAELRAGDCAAYFNEHMSPMFRSSTSGPAMKTLIAQCQRNEDTRETYIEALELAKRLSPTYEQSGTRAIYDMQGQGLPFNRFVLEKVSGKWYVAE